MASGSMKIKELHRKLSDDDFEAAFRDKTLRPGWFTHEAHLRLAFIHITKYGLDEARNNMRSQIRAFAENLGIYDKYHDTVTIAAVYMVNEYMKDADNSSFDTFLNSGGNDLRSFKELLNKHYSYNVFRNQEARQHYIAPDLIPFSA